MALYWRMLNQWQASSVTAKACRAVPGVGINGMAKRLNGNTMTSKRICEPAKGRLERCRVAGSGCRRYLFRVAVITELLTQGVPMEEAQYLAGHAEPRATGGRRT